MSEQEQAASERSGVVHWLAWMGCWPGQEEERDEEELRCAICRALGVLSARELVAVLWVVVGLGVG